MHCVIDYILNHKRRAEILYATQQLFQSNIWKAQNCSQLIAATQSTEMLTKIAEFFFFSAEKNELLFSSRREEFNISTVKQKQKNNTFLRAWGLNTFVDSCRIDKQITAL